jgi:hypothetical protein
MDTFEHEHRLLPVDGRFYIITSLLPYLLCMIVTRHYLITV